MERVSQTKAAGSIDAAGHKDMSIQQLLEHIVALCSFMEETFSSEQRYGRAHDFLQLLKEERRALEILERRMDEALSHGTSPGQFERKLAEIQEAHSRCQAALRKRAGVTRGIIQKLQARQAGQQTYSENRT